MLYLAVAVTNVIILAAAVSCIGSSFAISMEEKRKSYGMLASVGATPRQIRQSVYYEAFLTGRTAIPGNCAGTVAFDRRNFCYQSVVVRAEYRTVSACSCGMADAYRRYLTFGCHSCSFRAPSGKTGGKKFSGCGNARAGKEKPPGKKADDHGCNRRMYGAFILVSYFMGVQTISVGQSNHMFDDHANVSVDVQEAGR